MQTYFALFSFGVLFCIFTAAYAAPGSTDDRAEWMEQMKKCGNDEINVKEAFKGMEKCKPQEASNTEATSADVTKKNMCLAVCAWKEQGILDASGKFLENGCKEYVDKVYPEKYRADALVNLKECVTNSSSTFSMDDKCSGYKQFKFCSFRAHLKTCGIKLVKKPHGDKE